MAEARRALPSPEEQRALHQNLVAGDVTAPASFAAAFMDQLVAALLHASAKTVPDDLIVEAVGTAIIDLIKNPAAYQPDRGKMVFGYLRMSAEADLKNLLQREQRHRQRTIPISAVEHSPDGGKYLGRTDDPSLGVEVDEAQRNRQHVLRLIQDGLSEEECQALALLEQGERKTAAYAQVLQLEHLTPAQQRAAVKRVKDKLLSRLRRARRGHDQSP